MKKNAGIGVALVMVIAVLFALVTCEDVYETYNSEASLKSITIKGLNAVVPEGAGINQSDFVSSAFDLSSMTTTVAQFDAAANPGGQVADAGVSVEVPEGSVVYYLKTSSALKPAVDSPDWTSDSTFTFNDKDYLYIQVTSEDLKAQKYYRAIIKVQNSQADLLALTLNGKNSGLVAGDGNETFASVVPKTVIFSAEGGSVAGVVAAAVTKDPDAAVRYGKVAAGVTGEPTWGTTATFDLDEGDKLYVEVTPTAGQPKKYYGVVLAYSLADPADSAIITVAGVTGTLGTKFNTPPTGTPGTSDAKGTATAAGGDITLNAAETTGPIVITELPSGAVVEYGIATGVGNTFTHPASWTTVPNIADGITDGQFLAIRITSQSGFVSRYYYVKVTVL